MCVRARVCVCVCVCGLHKYSSAVERTPRRVVINYGIDGAVVSVDASKVARRRASVKSRVRVRILGEYIRAVIDAR